MRKKLLFALALGLTFLFAGCSSVETRRASTKPAPKRTQVRGDKKGVSTRPTTGSSTVSAAPALPNEAQKAQDLEKQGHFRDALREYVSLSVSATNASMRDTYRLKSLEILDQRLDEEEMKRVANDSDYGFVRGHALYQLGTMALDRRETDDARKYFSSVVTFLPGSDLAFRAQEFLAQLESIKYVEPKNIGVILPLSGKNAVIGQKALRGIAMGLGLNENGSPFRLAIMDSEGNPDTARRGVERLVKEDNVIAIVGSLLSRTASAVASKASELGVPTLALSQKAGITEVSPTVFRNALTSEMQVQQLVRSAMDDMGLRRFAILYPNDPFGVEYANIFWDAVKARGGTVTGAQSYNPKETDYRAVAQRLVGTWYVEARDDEFRLRTREKAAAMEGRKRSARKEQNADDVLPPVVDFDAVFIPDSAKVMGQLAAFLSYVGVRGVKLLGTNLWNGPGLAKRAGLFANDLLFVDSYTPDSEEAKNSQFLQDYQKLFNETPSQIEIQAYDSALLLRNLIGKGASSREDLTRRLTDLKRFSGAVGPLEMSTDREIVRPLKSLTLQQGQIVQLKKTM